MLDSCCAFVSFVRTLCAMAKQRYNIYIDEGVNAKLEELVDVANQDPSAEHNPENRSSVLTRLIIDAHAQLPKRRRKKA